MIHCIYRFIIRIYATIKIQIYNLIHIMLLSYCEIKSCLLLLSAYHYCNPWRVHVKSSLVPKPWLVLMFLLNRMSVAVPFFSFAIFSFITRTHLIHQLSLLVKSYSVFIQEIKVTVINGRIFKFKVMCATGLLHLD